MSRATPLPQWSDPPGIAFWEGTGLQPLVWSRRYGAGHRRDHRLGNYSSPQAGMFTVTATLPRVLGSGCPSIYPQWMVRDRHARQAGMSATADLTGDDRGGKPRHPTRFGRRAPSEVLR
ncbi:hypothetical protein SEA_PAINTERBOY_36 [Mycobacterium phage PainterBoy]|nr:hypothetical protein SEA_LUCYEDI_36 [Mycobacterium phage Lucyedi]QNJ55879.1 hypothetical protein SEA_PAINTERBOY_36 [Mycobacterium phage PainterBoy]